MPCVQEDSWSLNFFLQDDLYESFEDSLYNHVLETCNREGLYGIHDWKCVPYKDCNEFSLSAFSYVVEETDTLNVCGRFY